MSTSIHVPCHPHSFCPIVSSRQVYIYFNTIYTQINYVSIKYVDSTMRKYITLSRHWFNSLNMNNFSWAHCPPNGIASFGFKWQPLSSILLCIWTRISLSTLLLTDTNSLCIVKSYEIFIYMQVSLWQVDLECLGSYDGFILFSLEHLYWFP